MLRKNKVQAGNGNRKTLGKEEVIDCMDSVSFLDRISYGTDI